VRPRRRPSRPGLGLLVAVAATVLCAARAPAHDLDAMATRAHDTPAQMREEHAARLRTDEAAWRGVLQDLTR
jgi:hypothetical protein